MTGRLRFSPRGRLVARLLSTPTEGRAALSRHLLVLAVFALAATPALAQRGDTSGGTSTGRRTDPAAEPAPARRAPTPVEPAERRDIPQVGNEGRRSDTGRTPATPTEPVRGRRDTPAATGSRRGDTGRTATPDGRADDRRTSTPGRGSADTGRTGTDQRATDRTDVGRTGVGRTDVGRTDDVARRGETGQSRTGAVSVPRASSASWSTPDWDRWGRDRGYGVRRAAPRIDVVWPWERRYSRAWSPRYRYRQVVYAESGWRGRGWESRYEVVTTYRQRILDASASRARLELLLDDVAIYQDGRYAGRVTRFPYDFERVRATLYRGGRVDFDRDLMVIGDLRDGFELVLTRAYGGYAYSRWRRGDDVRAARLDFRRETATFAGRSRFFDPYDYAGYAPISLLPADADWLGDYGLYSASAYPYVGYGYDGGWNGYGYDRDLDDGYYYGYGSVRERVNATPRGATDGSDRRYETRATASRPATGRGSTSTDGPALRRDSDDRYTTPGGATIRLRREAEIQRVE